MNMTLRLAAALALATSLVSSVFAWGESQIIEWENPMPRFADIGLDPKMAASIIGDGQLVLVRPGQKIKLWSKGKVRDFEGVRFASAVTVIEASVADVKKRSTDLETMERFMPQIQNAKVLSTQGRHFMAEFVQVYDLPGPFDLRAGFELQHTEEPNGDMSILVHKGDIDTGVSRWEYIPLEEKKTLVVFSTWQDLDSAGLGFRMLLDAQPELKPTIPAVAAAMVLQQVKDSFSDEEKLNLKKIDNSSLPATVKTPLYTKGALPQDMLELLASKGTAMLVHPRQIMQGEKYPLDMLFVSVFGVINGTPQQVIPLSSDYGRIGEYFPWTEKVTKTKMAKGDLVDMKLKVKLPLISMRVDTALQTEWMNDNVMKFHAPSGDMYPMIGALEYLPATGGNTMVILSNANKISDDANFILKMMRKIPLTDLVMSLHMAMVLSEGQKPWIENQLHGKAVSMTK